MTAEKPKVNHGRNLFLLRKESGKKQLAVANDYGCKQERISQLENQEYINDDVLQWFAEYYGRTLEEIRDTEIELKAVPVVVHNNTFEEGSSQKTFEEGSVNNLYQGKGEQHNTINNPLEEVLKLCKEKEALFEQMLKNEQERNSYLIKLFEDIDRRLGGKK